MGMSFNEYRIMAMEDTFGYEVEWVYKKFETKAEVKSYLRHFEKENKKNFKETGFYFPITLRVEVRLNDEDYGPQTDWEDLSELWSNIAMEEIDDWCERKGVDPAKIWGY